jgi:hypothetical protein
VIIYSMTSFYPIALKRTCGIVRRRWTTRWLDRNEMAPRRRNPSARGMAQGRAPLPPLPRLFPSQGTVTTDHTSATLLGRIREWWDNGNILLAIGWSGVALWLVDQYLQYQMRDQPPLDKDELLQELVYNAKLQRQRLYDQYKNHKCLYKCIITNADVPLGGSHGLRKAHTGDVVEVLEERVGLGNVYHVCRLRRKDMPDEIGWFPIRHLQRVPWWKQPFL